MLRRNFIRISSVSVASLLFSRLTSFAADGNNMMNGPEQVLVRFDRDWIKLHSSNGREYTYKDLQVSLPRQSGALSVYLSSPTLSVKGVRLIWRHGLKAQTQCLGDQWERTYGDVNWHQPAPNKKEPWYVIFHDDKSTACFGVKTGCNSLCYWSIDGDQLSLTLDTHSAGVGVQLGHRQLHMADVVTTANLDSENAFQTARRFCTLMCDKPRLPREPVYGINDWYYAYGNNSAQLILEQTRLMTNLATDTANRPYFVIDDGWEQPDDFSKCNEKFKDMHVVAEEIKKLGMRPGLWTRPLIARHDDKPSLLAPKISGRSQNPKELILDPTIPDTIERVKHNLRLYKEWGYQMVKFDYSTYDISGRFGFQMKDSFTEEGWQYHDNSRTTAEIIKHLYEAIREAAGDMYVIGCNTLSHLSAGLFELCRIGDDTSGREWERTCKMGVNTLGFRIIQHNTFYAADGDCVGLTTQIPWEKNKQWMQLLTESSAPLFISAQPDAIGADQKAFIKECFAKAAKPQAVGEPLDWLTNPLPKKWKLNGREVNFSW
jgi:alpha-galactosidase